MEYSGVVTVDQPVDTVRIESVELADGRLILNVAIGGGIARLGLSRDEARQWRAALGTALNSPAAR
jgi:hypothetical protein